MSKTAWTGPLIAFGQGRSAGGVGFVQQYNSDAPAPSLGERLWGLMDCRYQFAYQPDQSDLYNFASKFYGYAGGEVVMVDQAPAALAANNIAASQTPTAGTALTLVSTTGAGITVGASVVNALTGQTVTGLLAIDGAMGSVAGGTSGNMQLWDPTKAVSRAVRVVSAGNDSAATFLVSGYDIYGFPMTQLLTGGGPGTATTTKAFKYIASVLPAGTLSGSAVTVGTTDVFGFPLAASAYAYVPIYWNNAVALSTGTGVAFTAADTTSPATNVTGDVRGTYNIGTTTPSNGTIKLQMFWRPSAAQAVGAQTTIWGVAQQ